jgi:phage baseplate assembly protein W
MNAIGLVLPLTRGSKSGYFNQSYDNLTQIKSNIINLLRTNTGERRMQPKFSGGLQELLFDQNMMETPDLVKQAIENKIKVWIPGVEVQNVNLSISDTQNNTLTDTYTVYLKLNFIYNNQSGTIEMEVTSNTV